MLHRLVCAGDAEEQQQYLVVIKGVLLQSHCEVLCAVLVLRAQVVHLGMSTVVCLQESSDLRHGVAVEHCRTPATAEHSGH